ncbi:MAG: carbohydrate ABC transporter permease [Thermomicrobiales bacterium]
MANQQLSAASAFPAAMSPPSRSGMDEYYRRKLIARIAIVLCLVAGFLLVNMLPAMKLADGSGLPLSDVAEKITKAGDGWVMVLAWLTGIIALICSLVFPRSERFIETVAVSAASLGTLALPLYIHRSLEKIDKDAVGLGPGMWGLIVAFFLAAVLAWLSLLVWNRQEPVLGHDWGKWVVLLPAVVWILGLTVFPLAYAISTSRYAFRNGKIVRNVGLGNFRKLFNDTLFSMNTALPVILTVIGIVAAVAVAFIALGSVVSLISDGKVNSATVKKFRGYIPLLAVPLIIGYLTRTILDKDVGFILNITYYFVIGAVAAEMILGFMLALLFNREIKGRSFMRTAITLPIFATPVAIGYLGRTIFYEGGGPVNAVLQAVHVTPPPWLSDPFWSRVTTIIADVWQWTPFVFIIALAGLQGLPQDILEASEVDGANWWDNFWNITLPLMAPVLWLIVMLRAIDAFKVVDLVVAMTLGGPGQATRYYSYFNYQTARKFFAYGEAAAQAFLLLFIVLVLVSLLWGKIKHIYEDDREAVA